MSARQPAVFLGHGNPMHAIEPSRYGDAWAALGASLERPTAVLCVSAHWYTRGTGVTAMASPKTIHDFGGFPPELFAVEYPAPGSPALATRVHELLSPTPVALDEQWGLDHGTWSVLVHVFPVADLPVVQLSIDASLPPEQHHELGMRLRPLRDEGVLILGSGNIVHNLSLYFRSVDRPTNFEWALEFDAYIASALNKGDRSRVIDLHRAGEPARLAAPTLDHYLPLLYVLGASDDGEPVSYPVTGMEGGGSLSMRSVRFG
jgi:4,5-DOPA dioxygenase extradiol